SFPDFSAKSYSFGPSWSLDSEETVCLDLPVERRHRLLEDMPRRTLRRQNPAHWQEDEKHFIDLTDGSLQTVCPERPTVSSRHRCRQDHIGRLGEWKDRKA